MDKVSFFGCNFYSFIFFKKILTFFVLYFSLILNSLTCYRRYILKRPSKQIVRLSEFTVIICVFVCVCVVAFNLMIIVVITQKGELNNYFY